MPGRYAQAAEAKTIARQRQTSSDGALARACALVRTLGNISCQEKKKQAAHEHNQ